jgi:hypothetical protein
MPCRAMRHGFFISRMNEYAPTVHTHRSMEPGSPDQCQSHDKITEHKRWNPNHKTNAPHNNSRPPRRNSRGERVNHDARSADSENNILIPHRINLMAKVSLHEKTNEQRDQRQNPENNCLNKSSEKFKRRTQI